MANKPLKFEILGVNETKVFLKSKNKIISRNVIKNIVKSALFMEGEVKQSISGHRAEHVSVDTGRFLNSVSSQSTRFSAKIMSNVNYAKFLEFGTSKFTGRHHFGNSLKRNKMKIIAFFTNLLNK